MGVDVVGERSLDKFLGPNRKHMRQRASRRDIAHVKNQGAEERPAWEDKPDDMEAKIDISTSTRYELAAPPGTRPSVPLKLGPRAMH